MQVLEKLREEHGYTGCYNVVQEYIRQARNPGLDFSRRRKVKADPPAATREMELPTPVLPASLILFPRPTEESDVDSGLVERSLRPSVMYQQSRRPQRVQEPEEQAIGWMVGVQQGSIPIEILMDELPDILMPELEALVNAARTGKLCFRKRSMAVMSYLRGISCPQICSFLQISTGSLFRYWRSYREGGATKLLTRKERQDKRSNNEAFKAAVFALLHSPPSAHGVNRTTWTIAELERILSTGPCPAGADTIRTIIKESGFKWRHARLVLTSHDPDYRAKVEAIRKITSELQDDEAFCSIDEYGPFAIKMKGGKKRVAPGEQYVVPQWQKSKGWLILTAALEYERRSKNRPQSAV
jgi:transposase